MILLMSWFAALRCFFNRASQKDVPLVQGETPWNPEILSHEPRLNDSSGTFYACGWLLGVGIVGIACVSFYGREPWLEIFVVRFWKQCPSEPLRIMRLFFKSSQLYYKILKNFLVPFRIVALPSQVMDFQSSTGNCCRPCAKHRVFGEKKYEK